MQTMLQAIRDRRENEEGFTLIELMVVVLIIAILIAIAIPTFLGARGRANDRAAQSSLRNGLTAAKTSFTDADSYAGTAGAAATLQQIEPSLTFVDATASTGPKNINVVAHDANNVVLSAHAASNKCYFITDSSTLGTAFAEVDGTCTATGPAFLAAAPPAGPATSGGGWAQAW
jgi:type IV pilus assembly protein PilA